LLKRLRQFTSTQSRLQSRGRKGYLVESLFTNVLLKCTSIEEALRTVSAFYKSWTPSEEEIIHLFRLCDAYWYHDGDSKNPHAELISGLCSNGFFDCLRVLKFVLFSKLLARSLAEEIRKIILSSGLAFPSWVIGSPMAAITFAHDVAGFLDSPINMFLEKDPQNSKKLIWNRMNIPENEPVLQIEELTTTSHTLMEGKRAIDERNGNPVTFLPIIGILVHRPPKLPVTHYGNRRVVALIEKEVWAVPQEKCPLCAQGSERVRPKQNWAKLTGKNI
jgi:orotate phosphoribosyltransferase